MYSIEPFKIIAVVICASLLVELLSWFLIYRRPLFKNVKSDVLTSTAKLEALKAKGPGQDKQVKKLQEAMGRSQAQMFVFKLQTVAIQGFLVMGTWKMMTSHYKGQVVAKLPFIPFKFVAKMTHASLEGEDLTDCAFLGLYGITSMLVRGLCTKFINKSEQAAMAPKGDMNKWLEKWSGVKVE